jgi:hypothetical protein
MAKSRKPRNEIASSLSEDADAVELAEPETPSAAPDASFPEIDIDTDISTDIADKPKLKVETVSLQQARKLSSKDKKSLEDWSNKNVHKVRDAFFARQAEEARKQFGHDGVYLGSQSESLVICIGCPSLAFEYVIGQDGFPLGLVLQIVAKHGVGKSALLAEFGRWIDEAGGGMVLMENETKFNSHWYSSIMGEATYSRMRLHRCTSVENWQTQLTWAIQKMKQDMQGTKESPGPGPTFPVLFGVDSIMGKMSVETQEKIVGKTPGGGAGFAQSRSHPVEAGSITKYMRVVPALLDRWPFALVLINHLRMKTDSSGLPERNKTGGEQVNFQESFELEIKKLGGPAKKIQTANYEGVPLQLTCEKNSFGPTGRRANTRMLWHYTADEKTGKQTQTTIWDWDWATVDLLNKLLHDASANTYLRGRLKDSNVHLVCTESGDATNKAWSKSLGMTQSDAKPWSEVGKDIRRDKKLLNKIRDALGITRRPRLEGNYLTQLNALADGMP